MTPPRLLTVPTLLRPAPKGRVSWLSFSEMPFRVKRVFWASGFESLGGHAARTVDEAFFVTAGEMRVVLERPGEEVFRCFLSAGGPGVLLPAGWWRTVEKTHRMGDTGAVCFCSEEFDAGDNISDRKEYEAWVMRGRMLVARGAEPAERGAPKGTRVGAPVRGKSPRAGSAE